MERHKDIEKNSISQNTKYWWISRKISMALLAPPFVYACLVGWVGFDMNKWGEYCTYDQGAKSYIFTHNEVPCLITASNVFEFLWPFLLFSIPSQLLFWAIALSVQKIGIVTLIRNRRNS